MGIKSFAVITGF